MKLFKRGDWVVGRNRKDMLIAGYFLHVKMDGTVAVDTRHDDTYKGSYGGAILASLTRTEPPADLAHPHQIFSNGDFVEWAGEACSLQNEEPYRGWWIQYMDGYACGQVSQLETGESSTHPIEAIRISPRKQPSVKLPTRQQKKGGTRSSRLLSPLQPGDSVEWRERGFGARDRREQAITFRGTFRNASCLSWAWVIREDGYLVYAYIDRLWYVSGG